MTSVAKNEEKDIEQPTLALPEQISWKETPNFKNGIYGIKSSCDKIAGDDVYGKGRGRASAAYKSVYEYLERSAKMNIFKCVEGGTIIKTPPTKEDCIAKLSDLGKRALEYYSEVGYEQSNVTDHWADIARVRKGASLNRSNQVHSRLLQRYEKRFSSTPMTPKEQVIDLMTPEQSRGMLAEGHVIAFLNSGLRCPECRTIGQIGWCDGVTHRSVDAFRDAVCMNCHKNGVITLFEIKTRWEKVVQKEGNGTYAGSFVALNTLMTLKANVYLVIASRDTGHVRWGKITSATMRGNHNWLYALQEKENWGGPSSYVTCAKGFFKAPVTMPPVIDTLNDNVMTEITTAAMNAVDGL